MADRQALIDWPLTPYTGWGGYGIQLAQALLEQRRYWPRLWLATIAVLLRFALVGCTAAS